MHKRLRVGILGGGLFGLSTAIHLDKDYDVTVFEQFDDILGGATYANHNRHHYGYHYPRSLETAQQCLESLEEFEYIYKSSIYSDFDNYYCISKNDTKTNPDEYISFCEEAGLNFKHEWPSDGILNKSKIALSLKVNEAVYDFQILKKIIKQRLNNTSNVKIKLNTKVTSGNLLDNEVKSIVAYENGIKKTFEFDFIVNAMYANYNKFCDWFNFKPQNFQFNLQELDVIKLPGLKKLGITIQDGPFPSFLPLGNSDKYLLAHVETSQLIREISFGSIPLSQRLNYLESNWSNIKDSCAEFIPAINSAEYIKSIFVDRVVDADRSYDDARITDLIDYENGCWGIFAAKIITSEKTAKELCKRIQAS